MAIKLSKPLVQMLRTLTSKQAEAGSKSLKKKFSDLIKGESFVPQQIFNGDQTGLFLKKLPSRTSMAEEE